MSGHSDHLVEQKFAAISRLIGPFIVLVGMLVLFGWAADVRELKSVFPGLATMKPNAAAAFVLCGACLWLASVDTGRIARPTALGLARGLALLVAALGLLTLAQYVFGWNLGIDQMLLPDPSPQFPGRMAPMTALNFTLLASALLLIGKRTPSGRHPSLWLAVAIAANAFVAVLGYLYGVVSLYQLSTLNSVALHTALLFLVACVGIVLAQPETSLHQLLASQNAAGIMVRRLLPAAVLVPPLVGWLRWQGEKLGYYSTEFGLALFATSNVAIFTVLVLLTARSLHRLHEQKTDLSRISDWQHAILDSSEFTVISTDTQGIIRTINSGAARQLGYAPEELIGRTPAMIHDPAEVAQRAEALTRTLGVPVAPGFEVFVAAVRAGGSDENDWSYLRKDGSRFWVRLSVSGLRDAEGVLTGFVGIGKDVSAQKHAEESLRSSEARMRLITDNLPALIAYVDTHERYRFANAMVGRVFGVDPSLLIGRTMLEVRGDAVYAGLAEHVERALGGNLVTFEGHGPGKDRDYHYRSTYVPDVGPAGEVRGFYAMTFDISDLKESQARLAASEERLRLITENVPALIAYLDREERYRFCNSLVGEVLGMDSQLLLGRTMREVRGEKVYSDLAANVRMALDGKPVTFEGNGAWNDRHHHFQTTYIPDIAKDGRTIGFYAVTFDITAIKTSELALADATRRLRLIADNLPVAITHINAERCFTFNNETHARWLGRPISELSGQHISTAHSPEIYQQILPQINAAFAGERTTFEVQGDSHYYRATYVPEISDAGHVVGVFGLIHDVTKIKQIEHELRTLSQFDVLTGLANRRRYLERLDDAIARSERTGQVMGLMFMDLDRFKQINDSLGHRVGDQVLQEFSRRIAGCVRKTDTVARLAGDEFVIILDTMTSVDDARCVALKIMKVMEAEIETEGGPVKASASIGIAIRPRGETDGDELLRRADEALYVVKARQRGGFWIAGTDPEIP
jgi:diguanylate cyclase (GGDEF)-like protein/PAS domain S-box-containing protein